MGKGHLSIGRWGKEGRQLVQRLKGESVPGLFEEEEGRTDDRRVGDKQGSSTSRCGQGARGHHVIPVSQREEFFPFSFLKPLKGSKLERTKI